MIDCKRFAFIMCQFVVKTEFLIIIVGCYINVDYLCTKTYKDYLGLKNHTL